MRLGFVAFGGLALAGLIAATPIIARAQDAPAAAPKVDQNVFVFAGRFQSEWVWETAAFWRDHYEDNFFAGIGYQHFLYHTNFGLKAGVEVGLGLRAGHRSSLEAWAGIVAR